MDIVINILLFGHFLGLVIGMGSGMAMGNAKRFVTNAGPDTGFDKFTDSLSKNGRVGLALLWITGPLMVWLQYGGLSGLGAWFWVKMVFVVILSAAVGIGAASYRKAKSGDAAAAARAKQAGMASGLSGIAVIFAAVFAFN